MAVALIAAVTAAPSSAMGGVPPAAPQPADATIAPGVTLTKVTLPGPNRARILTIDPASDVSIDVATARRTIPAFDQTSDIAERAGALAAVNGDFGLYPGRPAHTYVQDGVLKQTSALGDRGKNFAVRLDETGSYLGRPDVAVALTEPGTGTAFPVERWNQGRPRNSEVGGYTPFGGTHEHPPKGACSARLRPSGEPVWMPGEAGVVRSYAVEEEACGAAPMPVAGGVVLSAMMGGRRVDDIAGLAPGDSLELSWSLGWQGVTDAIGGSPVLIVNGKVVVSACSTYLCGRQPRTAVGIMRDGRIMLVVVDGRWRGHSVGMTLVQLADFLLEQGAVWALNLDGGGSSTMWIRGLGVVNHPSDGSERSVVGALLVLPGADSGEPPSLR